MIGGIIAALRQAPYYGETDEIEIAKGLNELPTTWGDFLYKIKRLWQQKRK